MLCRSLRCGLATFAGTVCALSATMVAVSPAVAQERALPGLEYAGPPVPAPPQTVARDEQGHTTVRVIRLTSPLRIDGHLDEVVYSENRPAADFTQTEPSEGSPATEKTETWILFDRDAVYVSIRLAESQPERMVLNEMRRDSFNLLQNEGVGFMFDTFYDRRNAVLFNVTPLGGRMDGQATNERQYNGDWNPVWDVAVQRSDSGWTVEAKIPFKSLRYRPGLSQLWGFNVRRTDRWKNEMSYLSPIPNSIGQRGLFAASRAATLVGLEVPSGAKNIELKPYGTGNLTTDRIATPKVLNDLGGNLGIDAKYGITQNLTADVTVNTDFAQVEADEQQVNLTRFSLFFPEKREFFLENQGLFTFGGTGGGGGPGGTTGNANDAPILFYSRRIGLNNGQIVPIDVGGRVTGRAGKFSMGLLNIQAGDTTDQTRGSPATNFSVVRLKRDLLRRSSVGLIATRRSVAVGRVGSNDTYGVDGTFAFFTNLALNTYWAKSRTEGLDQDDHSHRLQLDYTGDRYGVQIERLRVGEHFNPELGFLRRRDMRRSFGQFRFSPRPRTIKVVRKFSGIGSIDYIEDGRGHLETRELEGEVGIEFQNSDRVNLTYTDSYEYLEAPFAIAPTVTIPIGGYSFDIARIALQLGQQRQLAGNFSIEHGSFYGGIRTTFAYSRGRVEISPRLSVEPSLSFNRVDLPGGSFRTTVVGSRATYTVTPLMFVSALVQYGSSGHLASTNARLRWEYQPGSELFVVYNEERDTLAPRFPSTRNRSVVVKVTRLFRF